MLVEEKTNTCWRTAGGTPGAKCREGMVSSGMEKVVNSMGVKVKRRGPQSSLNAAKVTGTNSASSSHQKTEWRSAIFAKLTR